MTDICGPYVNHVGSTRDSAGNIYAVITQDGAGDNNTDVLIRRCLATADPMVAQSWVEVYRYTERDFGKHGYGSGEVLNNGDFLAMLSERNAANETVGRVHRIPGLCPPWPAGATGGYVSAPGGALRIFEGMVNPSSQKVIALTPLGIPASVTLNVQARVKAPGAGLPARVGPDNPDVPNYDGGPMLNVFTQAPGVYMYANRTVRATADNTLSIIADYGELEVRVDILGWWY